MIVDFGLENVSVLTFQRLWPQCSLCMVPRMYRVIRDFRYRSWIHRLAVEHVRYRQ
jgi:hypothetical protein